MTYPDPLIDDFVADMFRRNRSPRSQDAYGRDLIAFARYLGTPIKDATRQEINRYTLHLLRDRKLKVVTVRRNLSALRSFYKYLRREDLRSGNPAEDVELPKAEQRRHKALRVQEMVSVLTTPMVSRNSIRDRAVIEVLYGSGLRRAELAGLTLDDVDFTAQLASVLGKGNKRRTVPLSAASISAMQTYLHIRPEVESRAFFLSERRGELGLRQVWSIVKAQVRASGLPKASTHWMRHSFATHYIEAGGDLSSLQRMLGHANLGTTQGYVEQTIGNIKKQFAAFSMRDQLDLSKGE